MGGQYVHTFSPGSSFLTIKMKAVLSLLLLCLLQVSLAKEDDSQSVQEVPEISENLVREVREPEARRRRKKGGSITKRNKKTEKKKGRRNGRRKTGGNGGKIAKNTRRK